LDVIKSEYQQPTCSYIYRIAFANSSLILPIARIQHRHFDTPESGVSIVRNLVRKEGFGAFFKGLTPKLLVVGPKLVFSFTVTQHMIGYFGKLFKD
jgi:hypothetical protein